ncbi:MAG: phage tail tape measure protein [Firmicutes bacterium]|nr:phage tail tape measure protein [Bacillota bacterium]
MGTIWAEVGLNYAGLTRGMQDATRQVEAFDRNINARFKAIGESFSQVGRSLSLGVTAPLSLLGGIAAKTSMDFETSMANVWTIVDTGKDSIAAMSRQVEALSLELPQTAKQLADGLYQVISASIPAEKAMGVLEVSAKAAAAGLSDTFTSVDAITSVLNAYGMAAENAGAVSDIMFKTVERGKTTFPELAQNIGDVVSTASTAGVSFEELSAAISTLTKVGVRTPEAVTAINQAILTFIDPSDEAVKLAKQLGIEFSAASLASKGLYESLQQVYKATGGNIEALSALFPNVRALKGVLGLGRQEMQLFKDDLDVMRTSLGATDKAFEKQAQTSGHAVQIFKNELSALARSFGAELMPMLTAGIEGIRPFVEAFSNLPGPVKEAAIMFGMYAASIGPVLAGLGSLIGILTGPTGLALAIGAVVAAIAAWVRTSRDVDGAIERQINSVRRAVDEATKQGDTYGKQAEELDRLIKEYEELQGKPDKSQQEHERLRQVIDKIVQLAPQAVTGYDNMGKALIGNADAAKRVRDELWQLRKEQLEMAAMRVKYELPGLEEQVKLLEPQFNKVKAQLDEIAPRYYKMREVVLAMSRATSDAQREQILQAAIAKGIFDAFTPPATQFAVAEQAYNKLYGTFSELSSALYKAKTGILELKNAQQQLQDFLTTKPGARPSEAVSLPPVAPSPTKKIKEVTKEELSEFEAFGKKVKALGKGAFGDLQRAWADIGAGLKSEDVAVKSWAEQRARDLLNVINESIAQFGGDWLKAAAAASVEVKSGYQRIKEKVDEGQSELAKAMATLRYRVSVEGLGIEEQVKELEAIQQTDAYRRASIEEQRQLEMQLAGLREELRQKKVRDAYDEYQFYAQLYDFDAQNHIDYLNRLLKDKNLKDEEYKKLEEELRLWEKRKQEEDLEYRKKVEDAWNTYYLESGKKTKADLLREELKKREAELEAARKAGKGIELAEAAVAQAKLDLNKQIRQDEEDRFRFLVQMGALSTKEQLAQIQAWLATETEGSTEWRRLKLEELELQKKVNLEAAQARIKGLGPIDEAGLDQLKAWRTELGQAYDAAVALGVQGEDAAKEYARALEEINGQIDKLTKHQEELGITQARWEYEQGQKSAADYKAFLEARLAAVEKYGSEWIAIQRELAQVESDINRRTAEEFVAGLGDLTAVEVDSARERLLAEQLAYAAMGEKGKAAVEVIKAALEELRRIERNRYEDQVERGELTTQEQIDRVRKWLAAEKEGSDEWKRLRSEEFRLLKRQQAEIAEAKVTEAIGVMPVDRAGLEAAKQALGALYDEVKKMGPLGEDAATKYTAALEKINQALEKVKTQEEKDAEEAQRREDARLQQEYQRGQISVEQYKKHLSDRMAALESAGDKWSSAWLAYERELTEVTKAENEKAAQAVIDSLGDLETVHIESAKRILEAERAKYAGMGYLGEGAIKKIDEALKILSKREQDWAKTIEQIDAEIATSYEARLNKIVEDGAKLLANAKTEAERQKILVKIAQDAAKVHEDAARDRVAQAQEVAKTNVQAAIAMLQEWRESYANIGLAGQLAVQVIDKALADLNQKVQTTTDEMASYVDSRTKDSLLVALESLDQQRKEKEAAVKDQALVDAWYNERVEEETEKALKTRIGAIDRMNEEEVQKAQETLDAIRAIVIAKVGAESDAAKAIEAIQTELNMRLYQLSQERAEKDKELADARLEHEREVAQELAELRGQDEEAYMLSLEQKIAALRKAGWTESEIIAWAVAHGEKIRRDAAEAEYEFRKKLGLVSLQEQIAHEQEIAEKSQWSIEKRATAAQNYYGALMDLVKEAKLDELKAIRETLEAQLKKYEAMGEEWEVYVLAVKAALQEVDNLIYDKSKGWAARLGESFLNALGDFGRMIQTFQKGYKEGGIWRGLSDVFMELITKSRAFAALLDALNPIIQAVADMFGELIAPLVPLVKILAQFLIPIFKAVGQVFRWVADIVVGIWNAITSVINWALGWLGVHIPTIKPTWREEEGIEEPETPSESGGKQGTQISEITGPTRDLLVELLRPLTVLDSLPVYAMAIEKAIYEMRDAFLAFVGINSAVERGTAAVINQYNIENMTINASINSKEEFDRLMASLSRRAELATLGSGA